MDAATAPPPTPAPPQEPGLGADVRLLLAKLAAKGSDGDKQDAAALGAFYESRKDEPLWVDKTAPTAKAAALIAEIKKADEWGLDAKDFDLPEAATASQLSRDQLADVEMELSLAALKYARYARGGRITDPAKQLSSYLDRLPQLRDPKTVLEEIAATSEPDAYLRGLHPKHPQFEKLRQKYLERLKSAADSGLRSSRCRPAPARARPEARERRRCSGSGSRSALPAAAGEAPADETFYDEALAQAVKDFQTRRVCMPDGIVGSGTRTALNDVDTPSPERLLANMEEWRWMPDDLGKYYVWVNVPEFLVRVIKDDKVIHEERVITGLPDKQTPIFSDEIELVTVHPRWNVPDSIKVRELYPSLARGGSYFERQGLRITYNGRPVDPYSIDWSSGRHPPL